MLWHDFACSLGTPILGPLVSAALVPIAIATVALALAVLGSVALAPTALFSVALFLATLSLAARIPSRPHPPRPSSRREASRSLRHPLRRGRSGRARLLRAANRVVVAARGGRPPRLVPSFPLHSQAAELIPLLIPPVRRVGPAREGTPPSSSRKLRRHRRLFLGRRPRAEKGRRGRRRRSPRWIQPGLRSGWCSPPPCMSCRGGRCREVRRRRGTKDAHDPVAGLTFGHEKNERRKPFLSTNLARAGLLWPEPAQPGHAVEGNR